MALHCSHEFGAAQIITLHGMTSARLFNERCAVPMGGCVGPSVMGSIEHRHGFDFDLQAGDGQFGDADCGGGREGLDEELLPHLSKSS